LVILYSQNIVPFILAVCAVPATKKGEIVLQSGQALAVVIENRFIFAPVWYHRLPSNNLHEEE
jgi:hypothetical protein